jgi:FHS family Na+ dependent glucose MFS transporter 1
MFSSGLFYSILEIVINVCSLMINPSEDMEFWLLLTHGVFGLGGLIGPLLVYIFEINTFIVMGLLVALVVPFYIMKPSPENNGFASGGQHETVKGQSVPRTIEFLLCLMMFLYIGLECTYGGWISSYAVLAGVSDKSSATIYPTVFWIFITIFRFGLAFVPGTSSTKMRLLLEGNVASGIISIILIYMGYVKFTCYLSGIMFGISMSSLYPLVFSINNEFGMSLQDYQTGNIVTCGVVAEGILTMFVGMLMEWIHINMLFYSLIVIAAIMWIDRYICIILFTKDS